MEHESIRLTKGPSTSECLSHWCTTGLRVVSRHVSKFVPLSPSTIHGESFLAAGEQPLIAAVTLSGQLSTYLRRVGVGVGVRVRVRVRVGFGVRVGVRVRVRIRSGLALVTLSEFSTYQRILG